MDQNDNDSTLPVPGTNNRVSLELIKSIFIGEGVSCEEIAKRYNMETKDIQAIVEVNKLEELRAAYIRQGIVAIQSVQLNQAKQMMDMETSFKNMRLIQLQKILEDYSAYFARHGHFYKVHPLSGEVMKDTNGIPIQLKIPDVSKEIANLKESVSLSEGLKNILGQLDAIINKKSSREAIPLNDDGDIIDVTSYTKLFKKNKRDEE